MSAMRTHITHAVMAARLIRYRPVIFSCFSVVRRNPSEVATDYQLARSEMRDPGPGTGRWTSPTPSALDSIFSFYVLFCAAGWGSKNWGTIDDGCLVSTTNKQ